MRGEGRRSMGTSRGAVGLAKAQRVYMEDVTREPRALEKDKPVRINIIEKWQMYLSRGRMRGKRREERACGLI